MRYEHWLPAARPSPWPGAVLALSVDAAPIPSRSGGRTQGCQLASWHVQLCVRHGDSYTVARSATGTDATSFWDTVRTASLRGKNVWIIGACFRVEAAALDLWGQMERGNVRLSGVDSHEQQSVGRGMRDLPSEGKRPGIQEGQGIPQDHLRRVWGILRPGDGVQGTHRAKRQAKTGGYCILEDPPIVLEFMLDGGGSKLTWVDAANYGLVLDNSVWRGGDRVRVLSNWFVQAASALHSLGKVGWQHTAASQAMHTFRALYHETPILCDTHPVAMGLSRDAVVGGRCEAFRTGEIRGRCHLLDFRAFYPFLYATERIPTRLLGVVPSCSVDALDRWAGDGEYLIAQVEIDADGSYPVKDGPTVNYPTGRYRTVLVGPELRRAALSGRIVHAGPVARYQADAALAGYAKALYGIRQRADSEGHPALSAWAKRVANCLHGKFSQRDRKWIDCPNATSPWEWAEWYDPQPDGSFQRRRCMAGHIQREEIGGYSEHTAPAISAAICAAGRSRLVEAIAVAGRSHVYYCDTDSIIVDDQGRGNLESAGWIRPGEWGYLQCQISADGCKIDGPKHYRIGGKTACAGRAAGEGMGTGWAGANPVMPTVRESLIAKRRPG